MYYYQIDFGEGYENAYPDGYGIHQLACNDPDCESCWDPNDNDPEPWYQSLNFIYGSDIKRARVLMGSAVVDEREFPIEDPWLIHA